MTGYFFKERNLITFYLINLIKVFLFFFFVSEVVSSLLRITLVKKQLLAVLESHFAIPLNMNGCLLFEHKCTSHRTRNQI